MINVTVLAMIHSPIIPLITVDKLMSERLIRMAADLQAYLHKTFTNEKYEDVVIYMSYTTKYAVQWKIVNDVPRQIQAEVAKCCNNLGYFQWKDS